MHYQIREPQTMKPTFDASEQKKIKLQENEHSRIQPSKQMSPKVTGNIITHETPSVTKGEIDEKRG